MSREDILKNPFTVTTPEDMSAEDTVNLFVDVFSDFPKVPLPGHLFLHGPRGCGKSMIFRYLQPDCQCLVHGCQPAGLPFFSIYVPVKNSDLKLTELRRLEGVHASTVLNEHFMTLFVAQATLMSLAGFAPTHNQGDSLVAARQLADGYVQLLRDCGWPTEPPSFDSQASPQARFNSLLAITAKLFRDVLNYLKQLSFRRDVLPYDGPLCGYLDFLYPLLCQLRTLPFMPRGPVFLLIDDADNLNLTQTQVLNSWVASRTSSNVSIKISTQLQYKTYRTVTGHTIDSPHDYSDVNISTVYTASRKSTYRHRIREIVLRRLKLADIHQSPEEFFPGDAAQEEAIARIEEGLRQRWRTEGRGYRPGDDATRYARPDYMRALAGASKSSPSYSYAGFPQLVHISSGIIRYFLEAAAVMYSDVQAESTRRPIIHIPPHFQDRVVRSQADAFLFSEFNRLTEDQSEDAPPKDVLKKLFNFIRALGGTFRQILLSNRSERRVFSVAFSDEPTDELSEVLHLGTQLGYFHLSAIGNKDGTGRTPLYILSRRLAPHFNLDPTSFAGYLFITARNALEAMRNPNALLRKIERYGIDNVYETPQLSLFEQGEEP